MILILCITIVLIGSLIGWMAFSLTGLLGTLWLMKRHFIPWYWLFYAFALGVLFLGLLIVSDFIGSNVVTVFTYLGITQKYGIMMNDFPYWISCLNLIKEYWFIGVSRIYFTFFVQFWVREKAW